MTGGKPRRSTLAAVSHSLKRRYNEKKLCVGGKGWHPFPLGSLFIETRTPMIFIGNLRSPSSLGEAVASHQSACCLETDSWASGAPFESSNQIFTGNQG